MTGTITDGGTHAGIEGARLDVLNGNNAGKSASTDRTGTYVLRDLKAETFRLRASANGYDAGEQNVTVPTNPRADFTLLRTCAYTLVPSSATVPAHSYGGYTFTVTGGNGSGCSWTASTADTWIELLESTAGTGSGIVTYEVPGNDRSLASRTGRITVAWPGSRTDFSVT